MTYKHGMYKTRPYSIWLSMKNRCRYPTKNYSNKGIIVCDRWQSFDKFWEDMKEGYADDLQIDRINSEGNYEPSNCRWATLKEQAQNKRTVQTCTHNGETLPYCEWDRKLGFPKNTVRARIRNYGWSIKKAIETPLLKPKNVSYDKARKLWKAYKTIDGRRHDIGRFTSEEVAKEVIKNFTKQ